MATLCRFSFSIVSGIFSRFFWVLLCENCAVKKIRSSRWSDHDQVSGKMKNTIPKKKKKNRSKPKRFEFDYNVPHSRWFSYVHCNVIINSNSSKTFRDFKFTSATRIVVLCSGTNGPNQPISIRIKYLYDIFKIDLFPLK